MLELVSHQKRVINFGLKTPYFINGMEPGTGKTITAIELAIQSGKKRHLYICPGGIRLDIKKEIKKWHPELMVSCFTDKKQLYEIWDTDVAIISYELMKFSKYLFEWADIITFDEGHYLKNAESQRADLAHRLVYENAYDRCHIMTGTAVENYVLEFHSLMSLAYYNPRIAEPKFLKKFPTKIDFALHFSNKKVYKVNGRDVIKFEGLKNKEELQDYLRPIYISVKADDVMDLPKQLDKDVMMADIPNPELLAAFEEFSNGEHGESVKSTAKRLAAIAMAPLTIEYIKILLSTGVDKVVVFSDHPEAARIIAEAFGVRPLTSEDGGVEDRARTVNNFETFETPQVIVGTYKIMGAGFTLTRACNMVFNDLPWVPGLLDQARRRIIRLTQKRRPVFHYIHGCYQTEYIRETLESKLKVIRQVL